MLLCKRFHTLNIRSITVLININTTIAWFFFLFRRAQLIFLALITIHIQRLFIFVHIIVAPTCYVGALQFLPTHQCYSILNCFVVVSNFFVDAFCSVEFQFYCLYLAKRASDFNDLRNLFYLEEVILNWFILYLFIFVTFIRWIITILEKLPGILVGNDSNGSPFLLFLVWYFGPEIQIGSQPLTWSSYINPWFWRGDFPILHTIKLHRNVQGDVLLAILDFPCFLLYCTFHYLSCSPVRNSHHRISSKWSNHDK